MGSYRHNAAVEVRNACKSYSGTTAVLDKLDMTVQPGSIYGLLGASGCGKTTLLSCIVGTRELDDGKISVFGKTPGTPESGVPGPVIGYMPQETALYEIFTIKEVLAYYGRIAGMSDTEIEQRTTFLSKFLQLPSTKKLIKTLSGGQLRRVSLSVAMLHSPPLLILDEPTVGIDPLLRETIWKYMVELVNTEKTTIIITTHYIEEARHSNCVGILRKGRLLAEESPQILLAKYQQSSLEDVVLKLCQDDQNPSALITNNNSNTKFGRKLSSASLYSWSDVDEIPSSTNVQMTMARRFSNVSRISRNWSKRQGFNTRGGSQGMVKREQSHKQIISTLVVKSFKRMVRYPLFTGIQFLLPIFQTIVLQGIVGVYPKGMNLAYFIPDFSNEMHETGMQPSLPKFCATQYQNNSCFGEKLGPIICTFLNQFQEEDVNWVEGMTRTEALNLVQLGKAVGIIEIPFNYSSNMKQRLLYRNYADNETLDGSTIKLRMDLSNPLSVSLLTQRISKRFISYMKESIIKCGGDPQLADLPLKYNPIYGEEDDDGIRKYAQPALVLMFMFALSGAPAITLVMEKRQGLTERDSVAGVSSTHRLCASFIADSVTIVIQMTIFFAISVAYGMRITGLGTWAISILLVYLASISGMTYAVMWGTILAHEVEMILVLLCVTVVHCVSSGTFWPLESVVWWYQWFCRILPITLPIESLRAVVFKGWGLFHPEVLMGLTSSCAWISVSLLVILFCNIIRK